MILFPLYSHVWAFVGSKMAPEHPKKPSPTSTGGIVDEDMVAMSKGNLSTFNALRDGRLIIKGRADENPMNKCL